MRPEQEPTIDEHGHETHPAWATIRAVRGSGGHGVLFDSDIVHQHTMRVSIGSAVRNRDLKHDWIHGQIKADYIEVEMSEAQWASFISTPNSGSGTPCTVRYLNGQEVPGVHYDPRLALNMAETRAAASEAFKHIQEAFDTLEGLIDNKAPMRGPAGQREALRHLKYAIANAVPNVDYAGKKLIEQTEEVVNKAKADIEMFVISKAHQLGINPSELGQGDMLAIAATPIEDQPIYLEDPSA